MKFIEKKTTKKKRNIMEATMNLWK